MALPVYNSNQWDPTGLGIRNSGEMSMFDVDPGTATSGLNLGGVGMQGFTSSAMAPQGSWFDGLLGKTLGDGTRIQGWGGMALGAASGIMNGYMGMQQLKLAKDSLAQNKRQFETNYQAQKTTTNAALQDRQRARVASNAGAYQSVNDYMNQNGIK